MWSREVTEIAFVPRGEFVAQEPLAANAYNDPAMWYSRPGIGVSDPARYEPAIATATADPATETPSPTSPAAEQSLPADSLEVETSRTGDAARANEAPPFAGNGGATFPLEKSRLRRFFRDPTQLPAAKSVVFAGCVRGDVRTPGRAFLFARVAAHLVDGHPQHSAYPGNFFFKSSFN